MRCLLGFGAGTSGSLCTLAASAHGWCTHPTTTTTTTFRCPAGGGWDLVTIAPIKRALGVGVAPLGLPGMLNAGGAVKSFALRVTKHPPSTPSTHSLGGGGTAAATAAGDRTAWAGSTAAPGAAAAGAAAGAEAEEEAGAGLGLFEPGSPSASFMGAWRPAVAKLMTELLVQASRFFLSRSLVWCMSGRL